MTIESEENVLGFEIAINNVQVVKVMERQSYLSGIEFRNRVWESLRESSGDECIAPEKKEAHIGSAQKSE